MNTPKANLTVVILAAGLSERLGFAKQLILKDNQTLLAEKIQLALALKPKQVLVVLPKNGSPLSTALHNEVLPFAVTVIDNPTPQTGMAQSILLAIDTLNNQHADTTMRVLFLMVDQVALTLQDLEYLTQPVTNTELVITQYNEKPTLGVPVNLPFSFLQAFSHRLQGDKGFRALWSNQGQDQPQLMNDITHTVYRLQPIPLPHLQLDIDTPEQFELLMSRYQLLKP